MRVLVLHQHYWPENAAAGQILADVCEDVAAHGHEVEIICGQPSYRQGDGVAALPEHELHAGVEIRRVRLYVAKKRSIPGRLLQYFSYFGASLAASLQAKRPDVVLVLSSPPLLLGFSGALLEKLRGVPFVYSVQDLYPNVARSLGVLSDGVGYRVIDEVASRLYRRSAQIITLSPMMRDGLISKGVSPAAIQVIPNWADTDRVKPLARDNEYARRNGLCDHFVVQYSGNVGLSQGLEAVIDAFAQLPDLPITLAIVGDGNARERLKLQVAQGGLRNVRFLPAVPRAQLAQVLASCDLGLVPMRRGVESDLVPSKLYGIMAAGRPVLATVEAGSEVARTVVEGRCGRVIAPEDSAQLAAVLRELVQEPENLATWGKNGRTLAEQRYSRKVCTPAYANALERAAGAAAVS
jgi:colanic acid biosynthesis glycosyl transferase WcaI